MPWSCGHRPHRRLRRQRITAARYCDGDASDQHCFLRIVGVPYSEGVRRNLQKSRSLWNALYQPIGVTLDEILDRVWPE
jgi:hypothetical protein